MITGAYGFSALFPPEVFAGSLSIDMQNVRGYCKKSVFANDQPYVVSFLNRTP